MSGIVTAKTIARRDGCGTVAEWIRKAAGRMELRVAEGVSGDPVTARVDHGRWIADCECRGAEYVDPEEPMFWCFSCQNLANGGKARPVKFPDGKKRAKIEKGLSEENYFSWNEREEAGDGI